MKYSLYVDGASRGNPGPAAAGVYLINEEAKVVESFGKYLGETTNNMAEYEALLLGLKAAKKKKITKMDIFSDSELLVRQIQGKYRVLNPHLKKKYEEVIHLLKHFTYTIHHVRREKNTLADQLANQAIDDMK